MDIATFDMPAQLSRLPMFRDAQPTALLRLARGARLQRYSRGEHVFRMGETCNEFHVTMHGQVKLFVCSQKGQEKIIDIAGPGKSFAEALMFMNRPHIVNAQAISAAVLLSVERDAVVREMERDPRIGLRMLDGLSQRVHGLFSDVQSYTLHSGFERVTDYLLRALPDGANSGNVILPVTKATIASRLSITPEYLSRVLRELEGQRLIRINNREIFVPDRTRLARYVAA